ncbi:MAG: hypothetical protein GY711_18625 [bacterium]|nr:hypothetical protein [bacterium]
MRNLLLPLLALLLASCSIFGPRPVEVIHTIHELPSGVVWKDIISGKGRPVRTGEELVVHYRARLAEGKPIDSSYDRGEPVTFVLGQAPIEGWNDAVGGMRRGGRREATLPPEVAYGSEGVEDLIPPDATLVFEFELVDINR